MKLTVGGGALVVSLLILCLMPGMTLAKERHFVIGPSTTMEAQMQGSKGFRIALFASKHSVDLSASGHHASVHYSAPGHITGKWIKARLGHLGRVSLRFKASQKPHLLPGSAENCKGGDRLVEAGVFVGLVQFEGEQGYTSVHTGRVRGKITRAEKEVCSYGSEERSQMSPGITGLDAGTKSGRIDFSAFKFESKKRPALDSTDFNAAVFESRPHGLSIFRVVQESGRPGDIDITKAHGKVVSATIDPPAPFTGSATYQRAPASPAEAWTGSLAVEFPGLGEVSLAGSDFCAETTVLASCKEGSSLWIVSN